MTAGDASLERLLATLPDLADQLPGLLRAAATEAPVLLLGEPGSGRSTLARALHRGSRRAAGPMVEVDAGAVAAELLESELFGHRAGAFTGAGEDRPGRVAAAAAGTLVLDHLEAMPLAAQSKLLRLVAERRYSPLGGAETEADVRFLAIAAGDLPLRVERGAFRGDLFYRLQVLAFLVPPLRERPRDLPALVTAMVDDLAARLGRPAPPLAAPAAEAFQRHSWPGNLTELRGTLERALILHEGDGLLSPRLTARGGAEAPAPLAQIEAEHIRRTLAYTRGHQGRAAGLLGISRKALWEKRRRYGIP